MATFWDLLFSICLRVWRDAEKEWISFVENILFDIIEETREEMSKQGHNPRDLSRLWQRFVKQAKPFTKEMHSFKKDKFCFKWLINFLMIVLERNSWCWDSQYPLSFLSPLRPLWPLQPGRDTNKERPVTVSRSQRTANIQPSFRSIAPRQYLWQDGWTICQRKLVLLNKIAAYHKTQTTNSLEMDNISSFC